MTWKAWQIIGWTLRSPAVIAGSSSGLSVAS